MRKQWYTIQEIARLVEFSDQTIREWGKIGRIKVVRAGIRAFRIPRAEVERLLAEFMIDDRVLDTPDCPVLVPALRDALPPLLARLKSQPGVHSVDLRWSRATRSPAKRTAKPARPLPNPSLEAQDTTRPSIETRIFDDLSGRIRALDSSWSLVCEDGEPVLYGNDAPAAWRTLASCDDWIRHMERDKRKRLKQQQRRRDAKARKAGAD